MSEGGNVRWLYSTGTASTSSPQSDPLLSLGGDSPFITGNNPTSLTDVRESECYNETSWTADVTNPYEGSLSQSLTGSVVHAAAGDWLMCVAQNAGDEPSYSAADDCRGSIARILTMSAADNSAGNVDITLDRPLSGLPVSGDQVRVAKNGNVFANVTEEQARDGLVDHSMLYWFKGDGGNDSIQVWCEPLVTNGITIEVIRPGVIKADFASQGNAIALATDSPVNSFGRVLLEVDEFASAAAMKEVPSLTLANENGGLASANTTPSSEGFLSPVWLRRTIPAGTNPGDCVFALRVTSHEDNAGSDLSDFDSLNAGAPIAFNIAAPATRTMTTTVDRNLYSPGGARAITTLVDGSGQPLVNRSLVVTATLGTITQDHSILTNELGKITNVYSLGSGSGGMTETFTATLSRDPAE